MTASVLDRILAESRRRQAVAATLAPGSYAFDDPRRPAWRHLVSLDPSKPGRWRATRFEGEDPVGHVEAPDFAGAVRAAVESGANVDTARAVTL